MAGPIITPARSPRGKTCNVTVYVLNILTGTPLEYYGEAIGDACALYSVDPTFVFALLDVWVESYRAYTAIPMKNPLALWCLDCAIGPEGSRGQIACNPTEFEGYCYAEYDTLVSGINDGIRWLSRSIDAGYNTWVDLANWFLFGSTTPNSDLGTYVVGVGDDIAWHYPPASPTPIILPNPNPNPIQTKPPPVGVKPPVGGTVQKATDFVTIAAIALGISLILALGLIRKPEPSVSAGGE